ncbi:hydroxylysine kinase-like [Lineus longissimus]|uniref:hydroxylysine kinase-like n=1 Tax=Lineus longissimus TaxID=88925 RepID=UPI002B4EA984
MAEGTDHLLSDSVDLAKLGVSIRCLLTQTQARDLAGRLYGLTVTAVKEFNGYDDRNFHLTVSADCKNKFIDEVWPHGYVLKIVNTLDSKKPGYLDAQSHLMLHLDAGIPGLCPLPVKTVEGKLSSLETIYQEDEEGNRISDSPTQHIVRLLMFKPGTIFYQIPQPDFDLFYEAGKFLGKMNHVFKDFSSEHLAELDDRLHIWSMYRVSNLREFTDSVRDEQRRRLAEEVIEAFCQEVASHFDKLQKGIIHGDYNEQNILVAPRDTMDVNDNPTTDTKFKLVGVIDFGDIANACYLFEIGITIMYLSTCSKALDAIEVGGHVLAGYLSQVTLTDFELDLLRTVVAARYAQSVVLGEYYYRLDNNEYCLTTGAVGWPQLAKLWETPKETVMKVWNDIVEERKREEAASI